MDKIFVSANDLLIDTFHLALSVEESGLKPDCIIGIWRGGASISLAIQEYFSYRGVESEQHVIRTEKVGTNGSTRTVANQNSLDYLQTKLEKESSVLIVEDIFASGNSADAVVSGLREKMRDNAPENIEIASIWYKPESRNTSIEPSFYLRATNHWVVFPHELAGLTDSEMMIGKPEIATLVSPQI